MTVDDTAVGDPLREERAASVEVAVDGPLDRGQAVLGDHGAGQLSGLADVVVPAPTYRVGGPLPVDPGSAGRAAVEVGDDPGDRIDRGRALGRRRAGQGRQPR